MPHQSSDETRVAPSRETIFYLEFLEGLRCWVAQERRVAPRVLALVEAVRRDPFTGLGKPEPLRFLGPGIRSRHIDHEHRLVYLVRDQRVDFPSARGYY